MPFVKGKPKTGGRGKGVQNKSREALEDICARMGINVFEGILVMTQDPDKNISLTALGMAAKYLYPVRKAVEVSGPNGEPVNQTTSLDAESKALLDEIKMLTENAASERRKS